MQATGAPGAPSMWGPGRKDAFGAAPGQHSKLWYTVVDGNLSEVFFPSLDHVALHELRFYAAAPGADRIDDSSHGDHALEWLDYGIPAFTVASTHHEYGLTKEFVSDPEANALLIAGSFAPELPDVRLFVQASAHLNPDSIGNQATVVDSSPPALLLQQDSIWICIVGPFASASAGYFDPSMSATDFINAEGQLAASSSASGPGNVSVAAEVGTRAGAFQIAVGFAYSRADAEEVARRTLQKGIGRVRTEFERAWRTLSDLPAAMAQVSSDGGRLARCSLAVLRCLEDKTRPGAFVAAPAAPWGEHNHDGNHIYHLVWPRDQCRIATALVDSGDPDAALRALRHLEIRQRPDGAWDQNWWLDGRPHWSTIELDEVAMPILLAWRLGVAGHLDHDPYPLTVKPAAEFLIREGPSTLLDRWEDAGGLSPSTLAVCIAALVVAGEFANDAGEHLAAAHFRAVADYWNDRVEPWCCGADGQLVRLSADPDRLNPGGVSAPEFLELVRYGLRRPKDDVILHSLEGVDANLKSSLPAGLSWRRYTGDQYGEHEDGSAWDGTGIGRPWPVLTGERARHFVSMGLPAGELVRTLESFAGDGLMLPEQVWDAPDIPSQGLITGKATGSASPLGWAHAEYLSLLAVIATASFPDVVLPARRRYAEGQRLRPDFVWSHKHQIAAVTAGRNLRVQLPRRGAVHYTFDEWRTHVEVEAIDTSLGVWVGDIPCSEIPTGDGFEWTAHYATGWEGKNYSVRIT